MRNKKSFASANKLLDRQVNEEYVDEWTALLQKEKPAEDSNTENSVVIFRLNQEWLAISTLVFSEVATSRKIHHVPHKTSTIFLGVVNLKGQLRLCVSLSNLIEIEAQIEKGSTKYQEKYHRMLSIGKNNEYWIFPVNEVYGIFRCDISHLQNVPVTISKSKANYLKGVFSWQDRNVGYLDEDLLIHSLQRSIM